MINLKKFLLFVGILLLIQTCPFSPAWSDDSLIIVKPFGPSDAFPDPAKGSNGWYDSEAGVTETLFALDFDMQLKPKLAEYGKDLSPTTWEIKLKKNIRFHNNAPLNATAVKKSIERLIDENSPVFNKRIHGLLDIKNISVKGEDLLIIETRLPNAAFLYNLTSPEIGIITISEDEKHLFGTGPFQLEKVVPNETTVVKAFAGYWEGKPKLDTVQLSIIRNPASRMLAFESGRIDMAVNFPELDAARLLNDKSVTIMHKPTARLCFFFVRVKDGPLADPLILSALNYAVDREEIVRSVLGDLGGTVGASVFPRLHPWCNKDLKPFPHNPEKASSLLARAGALDKDKDGILEINGKPLRLNMWTYETRASLKASLELVKAQLLKVGIDSRIRVTKKSSPINQAMMKGRVDLSLQMWNTTPQGDPDFFFSEILKTGAGSNFMGYSNPELDKLVEKAKTTFNFDERARLYNRVQEIIYEESPLIVLFHKSLITALSKRVKNYEIHPAEKYLLTHKLYRE